MDSQTNLGDLIRSLQVKNSNNGGTTDRYPDEYYFYHQILAGSAVPSWLDSMLWIVFVLLADILLVITSVEMNWFNNLKYDPSGDYTAYLLAKIRMQETALIACFIVIVVILFQFINKVMFRRRHRMGSFVTSVLLLTNRQFSMILPIVMGLITGCLVLSAINSPHVSDYTSIACSLICVIVFLMYIMSIFGFHRTTFKSLIMFKGLFAAWEYPFYINDMFCFFGAAFITPIFLGNKEPSTGWLPLGVVLYGLYILYDINQSFISTFGSWFEYKIGMDAVVCGILAVIHQYVSTPSHVKISLVMFCWMMTSMLAAFIPGMRAYRRRNGMNIETVDYMSIKTAKDAVDQFRQMIQYCMKQVRDPAYLKWLLNSGLSTEIIPDIVRLCIVSEINMNNLQLPSSVAKGKTVTSLSFMAFQLDLLSRYEMGDNQDRVEIVASEMKNDLARLKHFNEQVWTENDVDKLTMYQIGTEIVATKRKFEYNKGLFPKSNAIQQVWESFCTDVYFDRDESYMKEHETMDDLMTGKGNIYRFLGRSNTDKTQNLLDTKSNFVEIYFHDLIHKWARRNTILVGFIGLLMIGISLSLCIEFVKNIQDKYAYYDGAMDIVDIIDVSGSHFLSMIEDEIDIPPVPELMGILGIDESTASHFRRIEMTPNKSLGDLQTTLFDLGRVRTAGNENCSGISLSIMLGADWDVNSITASHKACLISNIAEFRNSLSEMFTGKLENVPKWEYGAVWGQYVLVAIFVICMLLSIIFTVMEYKSAAFLLSCVKMRRARLSNVNLREELDFSFKLVWRFLLWLFVYGMFILDAGVFIMCLRHSETVIDEVMETQGRLAMICMNSRFALAYAYMTSAMDKYDLDSTYVHKILASVCKEIHTEAERFGSVMHNIFTLTEPLDKWVTTENGSMSLQISTFADMLWPGQHTKSSFALLKARYIFYTLFSDLYEKTLTTASVSSQITIQENVSIFIILNTACIICFCLLVFYKSRLKERRMSWYRGVISVIMTSTDKNVINYAKLMQYNEEQMASTAPMSMVLVDRDTKIIMKCNYRYSAMKQLTMNQLIGQRFDIDEIDTKKFRVSQLPVHGKNSDLVILSDIQDLEDAENRVIDITEKWKIDLPELPFRRRIRYMEIRIAPTPEHTQALMTAFSAPDSPITVLSKGASFLCALVSTDTTWELISAALSELLAGLNSASCIVAITEDAALVTTLGNNNPLVIVCGAAADRAHGCIVSGTNGRVYVDQAICGPEFAEQELPSNMVCIPISPITQL